MKKLLLFAMVLLLASCMGEPQSVSKKGDYKVEFLFEQDGCKVYRFYDGRTVYFSDCSGKTSYKASKQLTQEQFTF